MKYKYHYLKCFSADYHLYFLLENYFSLTLTKRIAFKEKSQQ